MNERIELNEEELEQVAGGNVLYVCGPNGRYAWGSHNPDVKYGYTSKKAMLAFIAENYDFYGEAGIFQALMNEGICYPLGSN